jgi:large repetitive protein
MDGYTQPGHGNVSPDIVGATFSYTAPTTPFAGTTTFTITASDSRGGVTVKTITIELQNQLPEGNNVSVSTAVNTPLSIYAPYWDPDGDPLEITSITQPASGQVVLDQYGGMTYIPPEGFTGEVTFSFTVDDGHGGTLTIYVTVTVA